MDTFIWYTTRAAGLTAYLLLFGVVALGIELSRRRRGWWRGAVAHHLHTALTWVMLAFLGLHVLILLGDGFIHFGLADIFIPFHAAYEPRWTGVGVIALYAALLVALSFPLRRWRYGLWRGLHLLRFPAFAGATVHGIMAGTDGREPWLLALYVLCGTVVTTLLALRIVERLPVRDPGLRWGSAAAAVLVSGGLLFAAIGGRMAAAHAGLTPAAAATSASPDLPPIVNGRLTGTASTNQQGAIVIQGTLSGNLPGTIALALEPVFGRARERFRREGAPLTGTFELRGPDGTPLFAGSADLRDGTLLLEGDGQGAYAGAVLQLEAPLRLPATGGSVTIDLSGGVQRDAGSGLDDR